MPHLCCDVDNLWSGGFGRVEYLPSTVNKLKISFGDQVGINFLRERLVELQNNFFYVEGTIKNSIGSRNQKNNDYN